MIKHEIGMVSLAAPASPTSYFMTRAIVPQAQGQPAPVAAATAYHAPATSALFLIAALLVLATELVERSGRRAGR